MSKHTFGPWCLRDLEPKRNELGVQYIPVGTAYGTRQTEFKTITAIVYGNNKPNEIQANARLIAAAPELLNKAIQYVEFYDRDQNREKPSFYYSFKAAIDKATK